jgi:uncharacterized protein YqgC (DUF456 family)
MLAAIWATLFSCSLALGWLLTLVGMPGNWLIVGSAALYAVLRTPDAPMSLNLITVGVLAGMAALGEVLETAAGAAGVARVGGSKRSAALALMGSLVGGIVGMFVGLPVPLVGSLLAAVVFAGLGALVGAMLGENWKGRGMGQSWEVGKAAFWGRLFGTLAKTLVASAMVAVCLAALWFPQL